MRVGIINRFFFKRAKKQLFVIVVFLFLTAFLLNLGLLLLTDYKENFWREHDRLNAGHMVLDFQKLRPGQQEAQLAAVLSKREDVEAFELLPTLTCDGSCPYGDGRMDSWFSFVKTEDALSCEIGKFEIRSDEGSEGVILPYIFDVNGFYRVGDTFELTLRGKTYTFPVRGFYNHVTTGSLNCKDFSLLVDGDTYERMAQELQIASLRATVRLQGVLDVELTEGDVLSDINTGTESIRLIKGINSEKLFANRYVTATICIGVLAGATVICVIVLLVVIIITLTDIVKRNIRNLGTLKAVGYVSGKIISPVLLSFALLALAVAVFGVAASYCFFPILNTMIEKQVGIPYQLHFLPVPSLIALGAVLVTVVGSVYLSIHRIRRILPIMAIRMDSGKQTKNTVLPLQTTRLPLNLALSLKSTFSSLRRNLVILLSVLLVSLLLGFDCFCYQYIVKEPTGILLGLFGNISDYDIYLTPENEEDFLTFAREDARIQSVYMFERLEICHVGGYRLSCSVINEDTPKFDGGILVSGTFPQTPEEVAVNIYYLDKRGLQIGDSMTLSVDNAGHTYRICGTFQDAGVGGRNVMLLREGYEKLAAIPTIAYSLLLRPGTDGEQLVEDLEAVAHPVRVENYGKTVATLSSSYIAMLTAISVFLFFMSFVIIVLMLYVVITIMMDSRKREYGIFKALGFRTRQIVFQMAFGLMPFGIVGTVLGLAISRQGIVSFLSAILRDIGICKIGGEISPVILTACGLGLLSMMFAVACLLALRVRHIVPHDLFNRE